MVQRLRESTVIEYNARALMQGKSTRAHCTDLTDTCFCCVHLFHSADSLCHMGMWPGKCFVIDSEAKKGQLKLIFCEWSQSPVACLLVSSAEAVQGSPVLVVACGRTGFKCVSSGGGSFGRAREQSGPPASFNQSLRLFKAKYAVSVKIYQQRI